MTVPVPRLALVLARATNGVIGKEGGLPWHLPEDLKHFRRLTMGHAILMGRKTYESVGKPLPGRRNIVISRRPGYVIPGCEVAKSVDDAIALARQTDPSPRVIGGVAVYLEALSQADTIFLTEVDLDVEGDAIMPPFAAAEWQEVERRAGETPGVSFVTLVRRQTADPHGEQKRGQEGE